MRIQPDQLDLFVQVTIDAGEDLLEHLRIQEECRAQVESKPVCFQGSRPSAGPRHPLDHANVKTRLCQQHRAGQAARTGPDHNHALRHQYLPADPLLAAWFPAESRDPGLAIGNATIA